MTTAIAPLARTLRPLYLGRFAFAVIWALVLIALGRTPAIATVLLIVYPLVDAACVIVELRASAGLASGSRTSAIVNVATDVVAAVALGIASSASASAALVVFGAWAIVSGLTQLVTAVARRRVGGQWPLILSGGISVLAGSAFAVMGATGADSVTGVGGYAIVGGIFFLVSAIRLIVTTRAGSRTPH